MIILWAWVGLTYALSRRDNSTWVYDIIPLSNDGTEPYYNISLGTESAHFMVRFDIIQPETWLMDASFYNCTYLMDWLDDQWAANNSSFGSATSRPEYLATVCAGGGVYTPSANPPDSEVLGVANGDKYEVPYVDAIYASGEFTTDDLSVKGVEGDYDLANFTFVNVDNTSVYYGALGLAGHPKGSGFLDHLRDNGDIASSGYSMWFSDAPYNTSAKGELRPGFVDSRRFDKPFVAFPLLDYEIWGSNSSGVYTIPMQAKLPTVLLTYLSVENPETEESQGLFSVTNATTEFTSDGSLPLLLDSRAVFSYLPLEVIINLALQLNAFYSDELERWVVSCSNILASSATLNFELADSLTIKIPIWKFMAPIYYNNDFLHFSNGQSVCSLNFKPSFDQGFSSLGIPFLTNVFMAVDNDGGWIAFAPSSNSTSDLSEDDDAVDVIASGTIPWASSTTPSTSDVLFITAVPDSTDSPDLPSRFSGVISGNVFLTNEFQSTATSTPGTASAAKEHSTSGGGSGLWVSGWVVMLAVLVGV